jgi:hypothetical protein
VFFHDGIGFLLNFLVFNGSHILLSYMGLVVRASLTAAEKNIAGYGFSLDPGVPQCHRINKNPINSYSCDMAPVSAGFLRRAGVSGVKMQPAKCS